MKKGLALLLAASLTFGAVPAALAAEVSFKLTTDVSVQTAQAKAYTDLLAQFSAAAPDLSKIKADYVSNFQAKVQKANSEIDASITFVLDAAIKGEVSPAQAKQAVDKGLQGYFYGEITNLTKVEAKNALVAGDKAKAKAFLEQAIELYTQVLAPTAAKRDTYYKDLGVHTRDLLDTTVVPGLLQAVEEGNVNNYNLFRQMFDKTMIKVFHLAALKYAKTAPTQKDAALAKVEMTEGYFFFLPIYASLKAGSAADADAIKAAFGSADQKKLNEAAIKANFAAAFNGKISGYVQKTIDVDMAKGDWAAAQEHAMEGNMFLAAEEVLIKEKLGDEAYTQAIAHGEDYYKAVVAKNAKEANVHAVQYLKIIAKLDGVTLKVGEKKLLADGKEVTVDAASYVNAKTNRTLVPTRFISDALGATVNFDKTAKIVTIVKGDMTTELKLGSDKITVNGKVLADKKLEQPVEVKKNFSFIPLRAVAELFGDKVFYANKEIVIVK